MEQKESIIKLLVLFLALVSVQCENENDKIDEIGLNYEHLELLDDFEDNAGVVTMKKYSITKKKGSNYFSLENNQFINKMENAEWKVENWTEEVNIDLNFIYENFKNTDLKKNISYNKSYFLYGYKGKKRDLFAVKLFVYIPNKELLYYFEITP